MYRQVSVTEINICWLFSKRKGSPTRLCPRDWNQLSLGLFSSGSSSVCKPLTGPAARNIQHCLGHQHSVGPVQTPPWPPSLHVGLFTAVSSQSAPMVQTLNEEEYPEKIKHLNWNASHVSPCLFDNILDSNVTALHWKYHVDGCRQCLCFKPLLAFESSITCSFSYTTRDILRRKKTTSAADGTAIL